MMRAASSLSNRIFLASTLLATLSLGFAFWFINASVTREAEEDLRRGLGDAALLVDQHRTTTLTDAFTRLARLVADLPTLKAALATDDQPTAQPIVLRYRERMNVDLLVASNTDGRVLGSTGAEGVSLPVESTSASLEEWTLVLPHPRGLLQLVSVPIQLGVERPEVLGRLTAGFYLDHARALQFKRVTDSEIAFGAAGRIVASSLPPETQDGLRQVMNTRDMTSVSLGRAEYLAVARPISQHPPAGAAVADNPVVVVLRSRTDRLKVLSTLRAGLAGALLVAVLLATIVSYGVARTITRPLAAVTGAMADVAATGDLTRRVPVRSHAWDDEDARLLAGAFNTLTESIARFRREEGQKERLSALGRLSTVVAHEIRNPLMIIRTSLRTLSREHVTPAELREAVADIDEETARLNRIVTEVLDFAKPLRFDLGETNVNDVCRASAAAASAGDAEISLAVDLDPGLPAIVTDAERLRTALVNILTNARAAVQSPAAAVPRPSAVDANVVTTPDVLLRTRQHDGHVVVTIRDWGVGISDEDMAHIFDPYFTTRRAGTGLGLPISRNIIEGLGGTIAVTSKKGEGTEIRVELPLAPRGIAS